jgi:hypothetical protein
MWRLRQLYRASANLENLCSYRALKLFMAEML